MVLDEPGFWRTEESCTYISSELKVKKLEMLTFLFYTNSAHILL